MTSKKLCDYIMRELSGSRSEDVADLLRELNSNPKMQESLALLETRGYISVQRAWGGTIVSVSTSQRGNAYFTEKAERRREKWLDRLYGFISGVAVTAIGGLIVQWLAG